MSEHMAEPDTRERNPKVQMIWGLLAPYIASEDPPDLSNDDQAEILTAGALPQVWELVLELEAKLSKMERGMKEEAARAWYYHDDAGEDPWDMLSPETKRRYITMIDDKYIADRLETLAGGDSE